MWLAILLYEYYVRHYPFPKVAYSLYVKLCGFFFSHHWTAPNYLNCDIICNIAYPTNYKHAESYLSFREPVKLWVHFSFCACLMVKRLVACTRVMKIFFPSCVLNVNTEYFSAFLATIDYVRLTYLI